MLKLYLQSIAQPVQCTAVEIRDNGNALATFSQAIDIELLNQRARLSPFPGNVVPVLRPLGSTTTILVSNLPPQTEEYVVKLYFNSLGCSVQEVMMRPPHHAVVSFNNIQSVQKVMSQPQLLFDSTPITAKEFFLFLDTLPPGTPQSPTHASDIEEQPVVESPPPAKHMWGTQKKKIKPEREHFLQHTLPQLNKELQDSSAHASLENESGVTYLIIKPLPEAGELQDWEERVSGVVEEQFADFKHEECSLSSQAKGDVLEYTMRISRSHPELFTNATADSLIVAGRADIVDSVVRKVNDINQAAQVVETDLEMPSKSVKYLMKFCSRELQSIPEVSCQFHCEEGVISVRANPMALQRFQDLIDEKLKEGFEKTLLLVPEAFKLLSSNKGKSKIENAIPRSSRLVYQFEEVTDGQYSHQMCFLSPDKGLVREAATVVEQFTAQKSLKLSKEALNICESSDRDWVQCKERLTREFLILITVSSDSVIVTGESIALQNGNNVLTQIKRFLDDKVSVDDTLDYEASEWRVIRDNMKQKISAVKDEARHRSVTLVFPKEAAANKATFRIKGEPAAVVDIKTQLKMLKADVQVKEEKVRDVPGLILVLKSLEDKLHRLEQTHKAVIEVDIESGENGASPTATAPSIGERPVKILTGTCNQHGTIVTVFMGDFTQLSMTGTIINFLPQSPNYRVGCLKTIIDAGGPEVQREIQTRVSQSYLQLRYTQVFKTKHGQLKCSQLVHCVIPIWQDGNQEEAGYLDEGLTSALKSSAGIGPVAIVPVTSKPFGYPVSVFAGKVVEAVAGSRVEVVIFIEDVAHATEFEKTLQAKDFRVVKESHRKPPPAAVPPTSPHGSSGGRSLTASVTASARSISSDLSTFITVTKGSILDVQADVYVNSTNIAMELSQGKLGSVLLKACGKELQDECKQYAPLQPGGIAVTGAKNLKCKKIFHVALPDYKGTANPERVFRETMQKVLRAAETEQASSIAFPSLGVAGLSYPPEVSAKILFDEVIEFHARNPSVIKMFHFVIYEKHIHQVFTKVYAQRMTSDAAPALQVATPVHHKADKHVGTTQLQVVLGNIADASTDVIVNTTAEDMNLQANAVSRAISKKAGPKLQSACKNYVDSGVRLEQGNIAVTQACGQLSCKKVIHAHIPIRDEAIRASSDPKQLIDKIVTACLKNANDDGMHSISFPAFGTGAGGYAVEEVAESMLLAFQRFGKTNPKSVKKVQVVIYEQDQHDKFYSVFCKFFGQPVTTQGYGILHNLKATLGMGSQSKGVSVDLQNPRSRTHSVIGPTRGFSLEIRPSSLVSPVAVFKIFAATPQTAERVVTAIRDGIKEHVGNEEIDEEVVQFLLEDDIEDMVRHGDDLGVVVKYMPKVKKIAISGQKAKVGEAKLEIIMMMRDIERARADLQIYQWETVDSAGVTEPYPDPAAVRLERACRKNSVCVEMAIDNIAVVIDLQKMTETEKDTGIMRTVKRVKKISAIDYPATWEDQPKDAKGTPLLCHMAVVPDTTQEYQDAVKDFKATMGTISFTIVQVQRIQNHNEYTRHCAFRETMKRKYGRAVVEKKVFHGTKEESMKAICFQGFNRIFAADANAAVLGKGVYFATNASYSAQDKYSARNKDGHKHMFVCNLIVGEVIGGSGGMKVAPPLPYNPQMLHDTLVDRVANPSIYVAMSDSQAYPEYLITFKV